MLSLQEKEILSHDLIFFGDNSWKKLFESGKKPKQLFWPLHYFWKTIPNICIFQQIFLGVRVIRLKLWPVVCANATNFVKITSHWWTFRVAWLISIGFSPTWLSRRVTTTNCPLCGWLWVYHYGSNIASASSQQHQIQANCYSLRVGVINLSENSSSHDFAMYFLQNIVLAYQKLIAMVQ